MTEKMNALPHGDREVVEAFFADLETEFDKITSEFHTDEIPMASVSEADFSNNEDLGDFSIVLSPEHIMSMGAPVPIILADEYKLSISFYLQSEINEDPCAVFSVVGVTSFEQDSNVSGYDHNCVFEPFGYGEVWRRSISNEIIELVFGFHDTSFRVKCSSFSYCVTPFDETTDKMAAFVFSE